ncbi:hypothetical protein MRX96_022416 [Rhipicephalus microplus]
MRRPRRENHDGLAQDQFRDRYVNAAGSSIDEGEEAPDLVAGEDEGRSRRAAAESAWLPRWHEARDAMGNGGLEDDDDEEELNTWHI